jgi:hypothetical protein
MAIARKLPIRLARTALAPALNSAFIDQLAAW